jgi:hypothetical protein
MGVVKSKRASKDLAYSVPFARRVTSYL